MHDLAPKVPYPAPVHKQNRHIRRLAAAVLFSLLTTAVSEDRPGAQATTTATWTAADVGSPAIRGTAQANSHCSVVTGCPLFVVTGAGEGVSGAADQFTFLYQRLTGDGVVSMRVLSLAGATDAETGLVFRESLNANSRHGSFMFGTGLALRRRTSAGGATAETVWPRPADSLWMKLERSGSTLTASTSLDGSQWSVTGTQTVTLQATLYVGIAVTSRAPGMAASAVVSAMKVATTTPSLPSGWSSADVGPAVSPGAASYADSTFIGVSSAPGVRGRADAFRFAYYRTRGDVRLIARVAASQGRNGRQAGIMLRNTLDPGSIQEALLVDDVGMSLVKRTGAGASATTTRVGSRLPPLWLRLERVGSMITSSYSTNGTTWKSIATDTVPLAADLYVGLAVSAGPSESQAAAAFDQVSLVSVAANRAPDVSIPSPLTGALFRRGDPVVIAAMASDPDDRVVRVEFKVNGTLLGTDTTAPYSATWTAGTTGLYYLTATAVDDDGASTTSAAVPVTSLSGVSGPPPPPDEETEEPTDPPPTDPPPPNPPPSGTGPWQLVFEASFDHPMIDSYVLDIRNAQTRALVFTRNLGKPAVAGDRLITVDVDATVEGLGAGEYEVVVTAVEGAERSSSSPFYMAR